MSTFKVSPQEDWREAFTVEAPTIESAAILAVHEMHPGGAPHHPGWRNLTARRTTGIRGLSGWFRAYIEDTRGDLNSYGRPFHVGSKS